SKGSKPKPFNVVMTPSDKKRMLDAKKNLNDTHAFVNSNDTELQQSDEKIDKPAQSEKDESTAAFNQQMQTETNLEEHNSNANE
ncbi:hypothetical protein, partial [Staphylococcus hominis]|uniref:hypothetical protein n=1 Tax=Staphylococcus hominis TaxID=1290 RepID=UPI0030C3743E